MDLFLKQYNQRCSKYKALGFCKINQTYARANDELIQLFRLKRWRLGYQCTIEFDIIPLCMHIPNYWYDLGSYTLDKFSLETYDGWKYTSNDQESIQQCVDSLINSVNNFLIPLFEHSLNCADALQSMIDLENIFNRNRLDILVKKGISDLADNKVIGFSSVENFYLGLKSRDYDFCIRHLCYWINYYEFLIESNRNHTCSVQQPYSVIKRIQNKLDELSTLLSILQQGDTKEIENIITNNEIESKKIIKDYITI